jgi:hypothetical protein
MRRYWKESVGVLLSEKMTFMVKNLEIVAGLPSNRTLIYN